MNEYVDFTTLKAYLNVTGTGDDALLKDLCTRASRLWDTMTRRRFYEEEATKLFDFQFTYVLFLGDEDLLSLTTLTNGDGNSISSGDYLLCPANKTPKRWIEIDQACGTYFTYSTTKQQAISVAGLWGYHEDYGDAWYVSGDTVQDNPLGSSATTLNVTDGTNFLVQQVVKVGDEQLYVTAIASNALTVERGKNGTTAAQHAQGSAITIWQASGDAMHWVLRLATWMYRQRDAPFRQVTMPGFGVMQVPLNLPRDIEGAAAGYRRVRL